MIVWDRNADSHPNLGYTRWRRKEGKKKWNNIRRLHSLIRLNAITIDPTVDSPSADDWAASLPYCCGAPISTRWSEEMLFYSFHRNLVGREETVHFLSIQQQKNNRMTSTTLSPHTCSLFKTFWMMMMLLLLLSLLLLFWWRNKCYCSPTCRTSRYIWPFGKRKEEITRPSIGTDQTNTSASEGSEPWQPES